jgi:Ribbon-helix-helix protein, copG family
MAKVRTTLTIDDEVLRAVKHSAARGGRRESEVIEGALRRDLGLDLLDELWSRNEMSEKQATDLAVEAQHKTRPAKARRKRR